MNLNYNHTSTCFYPLFSIPNTSPCSIGIHKPIKLQKLAAMEIGIRSFSALRFLALGSSSSKPKLSRLAARKLWLALLRDKPQRTISIHLTQNMQLYIMALMDKNGPSRSKRVGALARETLSKLLLICRMAKLDGRSMGHIKHQWWVNICKSSQGQLSHMWRCIM